jgi:hypothetical protein
VKGLAMDNPDQRRHPRLHLSLPIRFIVEHLETQESKTGEGVLKNISLGGVLFQVESPLPVQLGHVRDFSFFLVPGNKNYCELTHFRAQGLVLRIEPPERNSPSFGVAVQFLEALKMKDVSLTMTISPKSPMGFQPKPVRRIP